MNRKSILISATVLGGLAVSFGAFGAHALKEFLIQNGRLETFETAIRYQVYHAFALFIVGLLMDGKPGRLTLVGWLFFLGTLLFSGSLFMLSILSVKWVVYVTPIGGLLLIGGWGLLLVHLWKTLPNKQFRNS